MFSLKSLDLFGIEAKWRLFRQSKFTTRFSGFISLLFYLYLLTKFIILAVRFFSGSNFILGYNENTLTKMESIDIKDFEIAFCLLDKNSANILSFKDHFNLESKYVYFDQYNQKKIDTQTIQIKTCSDDSFKSIFFRRNFLKDEDLEIISKCFCALPKKESLASFQLKSDELKFKQDFLNFKIKLNNEQINSSNFSLKILIKDYFLGNKVNSNFDKNIFEQIKTNTLLENVNAFNFVLENSFLKKTNFFLNENVFIEKRNLEVYEKEIYSNTKYSIAEKTEENTLIKYYDILNTDSKLEILDLNFFSNGKRIVNELRYYGLNDLYIELSANFLIIFLFLRLLLNIYNKKKWGYFLDHIIEKRFSNFKSENKKLEGFFSMNYLSNLNKDIDDNYKTEKFENFNTKNIENDKFNSNSMNNLNVNHQKNHLNYKNSNNFQTQRTLNSGSQKNKLKKIQNKKYENKFNCTFNKSNNIEENDIKNNTFNKKTLNQNSDNIESEKSNYNQGKFNNLKKNNLKIIQNIELSKRINPNYINTNIGLDTEENLKEELNSENFNFQKLQHNKNYNFTTTENLTENDENKYIQNFIAHKNTEEIFYKNKKKFMTPKIYDLTTVQIEGRYDIRKNIKDIFAIPKSRNQIIKDFIFKRVLDIDTYTNALIEFFKLQKILFNKDLLKLFKKISNASIFEGKNFSHYDYCINSYFYRDSKFTLNYDHSNSFNNYIFENLKKEFYSLKQSN